MKKTLTIVASSLLVVLPVTKAYGWGVPVADAVNTAKGIISNLNEAVMILNQVKQLENDLKNLTKLDLSILEDYSLNMNSLFEKMGEVHGLMQQLGELEARFEELYPEFNNMTGGYDLKIASEAINKALDESREAMLGAAKTGQVVLENLPKTQNQLEELISDSQSAPGILQAAQAGNQINATISGNLMSLNGLMAQFVQAHNSYLQKENMKEAIQIQKKEKLLSGRVESTEPPVPMAPF